MKQITLLGRVLVTGRIRAVTGLRVGGSASPLAIGGVDLPVIRNVLDQRPYIPGSSLKGKMRSLAEKVTSAPQNRSIQNVHIHTAGGNGPKDFQTENEYKRTGVEQYEKYWVNPLFGVPGEVGFPISGPTRLVVRDTPMEEATAGKLAAIKTDLPFTEIKTEVAIDRITSQATPRQVERVPAGSIFGPLEIVLNLFVHSDCSLMDHLLTCLQLVEDDYIGGHGSRGSGKVVFEDLAIHWRSGRNYTVQTNFSQTTAPLNNIVAQRQQLLAWLDSQLSIAPTGGA